MNNGTKVRDAAGRLRLPWPLTVLDFEASALSAASYPIEIGVCVWRHHDEPIAGWSTLIRPTEAWRDRGEWSEASAAVHRIPREALEAGASPAEAMAMLNTILATTGGLAWCDGGPYDLFWLRRLEAVAGVKAGFRLGDLDMLTARFSPTEYLRMDRWGGRAPARHRARDDAERLVKGLARALGLRHGTSSDLVVRVAEGMRR